jgi:GntR family transcriptional regulator
MEKETEIKIDLRSHTPAYRQIIQQIHARLLKGDLNPGDQLPTVRQLAVTLGINFNTVARAYRMLDKSGVISTQHGRGTYIVERPFTQKDQGRQKLLADLTRKYIRDAKYLGFSTAEVETAFHEEVERVMEEEACVEE